LVLLVSVRLSGRGDDPPAAIGSGDDHPELVAVLDREDRGGLPQRVQRRHLGGRNDHRPDLATTSARAAKYPEANMPSATAACSSSSSVLTVASEVRAKYA